MLGLLVAGPLGAMAGAGLAIAATQPNASIFAVQRGRHTIATVILPRNGSMAAHGSTVPMSTECVCFDAVCFHPVA